MNKNKRKSILQQRVPLYQKNPVLFAKEACKFTPDIWQTNVLNDIANYPRVTVRSGQGVGKTGVEAIVVLWFLSCFKYAKVIATAPTKQQLHDVLWAEVAKWLSKSPVLKSLLKWTKTYIYMNGREDRWFAVAKTASQPENFQGYHEDNMLIIVDEASGVEDEIMEAVLGTLSGGNNKLFMCANPTRTTGTFYDSHNRDRSLYKCHKVSSLDSSRTNKDNIQSLINKYGEDSNVIKVRVLGDFPTQDDDVFIPLSLLENSVDSDIEVNGIPSIIDIGVDVARFGDDKTCIGYRVDGVIKFYKQTRGQDTQQTADDIIRLVNILRMKYPAFKRQICIKVDDSGVGGGVTDRLNRLKNFEPYHKLIRVIPVIFGISINNSYYADSTTYMMSVLKSLISTKEENGVKKKCEIKLPDDTELIAQLSTRKYIFTDSGKIKVESKKEMKNRGLTSPDEADCLLLCVLPVNKREEFR